MVPFNTKLKLDLATVPSPLEWDVLQSLQCTVSVLFWYMGMICWLPSVIATTKFRRLFMESSLWVGVMLQPLAQLSSHLLLTGLSTPLVLSVHTIVS